MTHVFKPMKKAIYALVASLFVALVGTFSIQTTPAHAASLTGVLSQPITALQQTLAPIVAPVAPSTPAVTQTVTTPTTEATQQTTTAAATNNSTEAEAPVTTFTATASTQPVATVEAQDQAVSPDAGVAYMSRQISAATANMLYKVAGLISVVGFIIYAATVIPRHTPNTPAKSIIKQHKNLFRLKRTS